MFNADLDNNSKELIASKKDVKDQESIQSSTTPDLGYHRIPHVKVTKTQLSITKGSQEVNSFPAGDQKASLYRRESMSSTRHKKTQMIHKRSTALGRSVNLFYWRA